MSQIALMDPDSIPVPEIRAATAAEKTFIVGHSAAFTVQFDALRVGADNVRDAADDPGSVRELAESIRRNGLLSALSVEQSSDGSPDDGFLLITAGHRRWLALKALGFGGRDPVPVHVLAHGVEVQRTIRMMAENVDRRNLSPLEEARAMDRLHRVNEMKVRDIAKAVGWSQSKVSQRLALLDLPPSALSALESGELDATAAYHLSRLYRLGAPKTAHDLLAAGASATMIRAAIDQVRLDQRVKATGAKLAARGFTVSEKAPAGFRLDQVIQDHQKAEPGDYLNQWAVVGRMWPDTILVWSIRPEITEHQPPPGATVSHEIDRDSLFDEILDMDGPAKVEAAAQWIRTLIDVAVLPADKPYVNDLLSVLSLDELTATPNEKITAAVVFDLVRAIAVIEAKFYGS